MVFMLRISVLALLLPGAAMASGLTRFDFPGARTTCATAMASNGAIAGLATNGTLGRSRAFLLINGRFTEPRPEVPAGTLYFSGINQFIDLVGTDLESAQIGEASFLYTEGGTSTPIVNGYAPVSLAGISDAGTLLGSISITTNGNPFSEATVAFTQTRAGKTQVVNDGSFLMSPMGMDQKGERIVGTSVSSLGVYAWSYFHGGFTVLSVPTATQGTWPYTVDSKGTVRGFYVTGSQTAPVAHGFVYSNGMYTSYDVPGSRSTQITAANDAGQFAGCYKDQYGTHGFYITP
jgi:hypothetical protein